jgi:hypothetical protein
VSVFPVVKGLKLRATKINNCGLPIEGEANRLVTDGFITVNMTAVMNDAEDLEQKNAEGKVCVSDRTPPTRKYYTPAIELCNVNTGLISMFNGWEQVLDYNDNPVGFHDQTDVEDEFGVMIEVWTGGKGEDDCPPPINDDIFASSAASGGKSYGYLLFGGTEWQLGDISIGAQVSTFTLTGRTVATPQWGKGPYNVVEIGPGEPGRLLVPLGQDEHYTLLRTPVAPPEITEGGNPVPLAITSVFTASDPYFGGPGGETATPVAPPQPSDPGVDLLSWAVVVSDPAAYTFTVNGGTPSTELDQDSTIDEIETAINAVSEDAGFDVTGDDPLNYTLGTDTAGTTVTLTATTGTATATPNP